MRKMRMCVKAIVMVLIVLFSVSCAKNTAEKKDVIEISFWSLFTGGDGEFFNAMIDQFNKEHPDIQMKTDTVKFDNYYTKLTVALNAKTAPDVVVVHQDELVGYLPKEVFLPLDEHIPNKSEVLKDFIPAPLQGAKYQGNIYALPLDVHPLVMYYNVDLFKQAGIDKIPETADELIKVTKLIQQKTNATGVAIDNTTATYKAYSLTRLFMSLMVQQGGSVLSEDNSKGTINNEKGIKAAQYMIDMVNKDKIAQGKLDYDGSVNSFRNGKAAIHFNGVWATGGFENQEGLNFSAVPLPGLMGKPAAWSGSHTLAVPKQKEQDPKKMEAIMTFMLWMTKHGELWAKAGHIPTRYSAQENEDFLKLAHRKDYAKAAESVFEAPRTAAWPEIYKALSDGLEEAVAKNIKAEVFVKTMEEKINTIISSY